MRFIFKGNSLRVILLLSFLCLAVGASEIRAATIFGLTSSNQLVRFDSGSPGTVETVGAITGLQNGETVRGIDFRPATGQLYALGSNNRLYAVNTNTGAATFIAALSTAAVGANFGFDFNPTVDRIRVVSDADQNLRVNPTDGSTIVDGALMYAAGDANAGQNPFIAAAAYTNSFATATSTMLFDIDANLRILVNQNPANSGTLLTIGALGLTNADLNSNSQVGFDITPSSGAAFASISNGTNSRLYTINLSTGAATSIGAIGANVVDIAVGKNAAAGGSTATIDFDGDGRTDYAVFRPAENNWYIRTSSNDAFFAVQFGLVSTDILAPGDYDGDGRTDVAVWRKTNGFFYVLRSSDNGFTAFQFGLPGDQPIARDYDGDGKTDYAVARRANNQITWYIRQSSDNSLRIRQFGLSTDTVAPGDYDGDGRFDIAVYRGEPGEPATFFIQQSAAGFRAVQWGLGGDLVVPGDYDGDGKTDIAVVRQGTPYTWYILQSSDNTLRGVPHGAKPHYTTQGDYDGDGKTDIAVFNPINGTFFVFRSSTLTETRVQFGRNDDYPVANYDTH